MNSEATARLDPEWLSDVAVRVQRELAKLPPDAELDVYVWSDGSVTGARDQGDRTDDLRLVGTFTPGEPVSTAAIEETVRNGLATVPHGDEPAAVSQAE